ncbi:MAG: tyrosine-type recombinase/integrase [Chloroflexota bacterium]
MTLSTAVAVYLSFKRSLGVIYAQEGVVLRSFARVLGDIPVEAVSHEACQSFCRGEGPATRHATNKHYTLQGLFRFLVSRGHLAASPLPEGCAVVRQTFRPYIYSHEELQRLLDATSLLASPCSPLQAITFRTLVLTLYGAGLRPGEGLRFRCCDVDLPGRVLAIWDSKFFKSRLVPIGAALARQLKSYLRLRQRLPLPKGERSAFFATRTGHHISHGRLNKVFQRLRRYAGIRRPETERYQPRLHDLRHTFAVHRLTAWYREGADVQTLLPSLSTYLGHVNVEATQVYLTMTPELLREASLRFERYARNEQENLHD